MADLVPDATCTAPLALPFYASASHNALLCLSLCLSAALAASTSHCKYRTKWLTMKLTLMQSTWQPWLKQRRTLCGNCSATHSASSDSCCVSAKFENAVFDQTDNKFQLRKHLGKACVEPTHQSDGWTNMVKELEAAGGIDKKAQKTWSDIEKSNKTRKPAAATK